VSLISAEDARLIPQIELLRSLGHVVEENLSLLLPIEKAWQPTDYLPDFAQPDWHEQMLRMRESAQELTDEVLVVLVGDMVTEEALPNYAISLNLIAQDKEGDSDEPWAKWMRGWVAEENRHGDLLNAFLRLTGRVDMRTIEVTVHHLLSAGFNPESQQNLYAGLVYTSFQERATKISHHNVGKLAGQNGDENLAKICRKIAGDESRHEQFYTRLMGEVMKRDPEGGMLIFRDLMRGVIAMPGRNMTDGHDPDLFEHFAEVAQRIGVYTIHDYTDILNHLITEWDVKHLSLSGEAADAQEALCKQAERLASMADLVTRKIGRQPRNKFSWIYDRCA
jgi:acyl-[acyl-carrier-protein] desaturase